MSKRTLLLADDSVTIQKVVNLTFADEGIDVITVGDGDSAIQKITESAPDVVLADVHMPGLSGYQVCEMVRENPATRELPVVLLVGSFEPFDENEAARVGANAFLTKPFQSIRQLVSQVSELMAASTARTEAAEEQAQPAEPEVRYRFATDDAPVAEAPVAEPKAVDTKDIDSLLAKSFGDPLPESDTGSGPPRYVDAGMDDEMIEEVHSREGLEQASDAEYAPAPEASESTEWLAVEPAAGDLETGVSQPSDFAPHDVPASEPFAEPVEDEGEAAEQIETAAEPPTPTEDYLDQFAITEQIQTSFELPEMETADAQTGARPTQENFKLDDLDLLELPPMENGKTLEFSTRQENVDQGTGKQVVSLSPELMETIVKKVVEKLSEK